MDGYQDASGADNGGSALHAVSRYERIPRHGYRRTIAPRGSRRAGCNARPAPALHRSTDAPSIGSALSPGIDSGRFASGGGSANRHRTAIHADWQAVRSRVSADGGASAFPDGFGSGKQLFSTLLVVIYSIADEGRIMARSNRDITMKATGKGRKLMVMPARQLSFLNVILEPSLEGR